MFWETETHFFSSFCRSDEETGAILSILGGKFFSGTEGGKYKGFLGAKRPKNKKFSRPKGAKMKKKQVFLLLLSMRDPRFLNL